MMPAVSLEEDPCDSDDLAYMEPLRFDIREGGYTVAVD